MGNLFFCQGSFGFSDCHSWNINLKIRPLGLALGSSESSCHLWCWHIQEYCFESPLLIQLPTPVLGKAPGVCLSVWVPATYEKDPHGVLGSWHQPGPSLSAIPVGNQLAGGSSLILPLPLFGNISNFTFQINKINHKSIASYWSIEFQVLPVFALVRWNQRILQAFLTLPTGWTFPIPGRWFLICAWVSAPLHWST